MAERKKLLLRLDPQVHDAIARWAADDLRSVNAQIEFALRLALRQAGRALRPVPADSAESAESTESTEVGGTAGDPGAGGG